MAALTQLGAGLAHQLHCHKLLKSAARQRQQRLLQRAQVLRVHVEDHLQCLPGVENRPPEGAQRGGRVDDVGVLPPDEPVANLALLLLADELLLEERRGRGEYKQFGVVVEVLLAEARRVLLHGGQMADTVLKPQKNRLRLLF